MEIDFTSASESGDCSQDDSAELVEKTKTSFADLVVFQEEEEPERRYKEHVFIAVGVL
jgi:hypothetical protein